MASNAPTPKIFHSRAPANLMLMGEHAVVHGHPALACALDQWIQITWQPQPHSQTLSIHSELANHSTHWQDWQTHPQLQFVQAALAPFRQTFQQRNLGLKLTIQSDFSATLGFGSSAAVLAATLGGLHHLLNPHQPPHFNNQTKHHLFKTGLKIIHQIQKRGSGTDLAASLFGGLIHFKANQITPLSLKQPLPLTLIYSGYKTPTSQVLQQVAQQWQTEPKLLKALYQLMGDTTQAAYQAWQNQNLNRFYHLINSYQGLMDALGVNDATLSQLIYQLREDLPASKISGSGLGDCVLGFGQLPPEKQKNYPKPLQYFSPQIANQGLHLLLPSEPPHNNLKEQSNEHKN